MNSQELGYELAETENLGTGDGGKVCSFPEKGKGLKGKKEEDSWVVYQQVHRTAHSLLRAHFQALEEEEKESNDALD